MLPPLEPIAAPSHRLLVQAACCNSSPLETPTSTAGLPAVNFFSAGSSACAKPAWPCIAHAAAMPVVAFDRNLRRFMLMLGAFDSYIEIVTAITGPSSARRPLAASSPIPRRLTTMRPARRRRPQRLYPRGALVKVPDRVPPRHPPIATACAQNASLREKRNRNAPQPCKVGCYLALGFSPPSCAANCARPSPGYPSAFLLTWGKQGTEPGEFNIPIGIAICAADEVFVTDHYNHRVQIFDRDGKLLNHFTVPPNPGGIALDKAGNIYLSHFPTAVGTKEVNPDRVSVYSPAGKLLHEWGKSGIGPGEFSYPGGMIVGRDDRLYIADQTNHRIQVLDLQGHFLATWGKHGTKPGEFGGNTNVKSRAGGPDFVALDKQGNLYTTEAMDGRVKKFTPDGGFLLGFRRSRRPPRQLRSRIQTNSLHARADRHSLRPQRPPVDSRRRRTRATIHLRRPLPARHRRRTRLRAWPIPRPARAGDR